MLLFSRYYERGYLVEVDFHAAGVWSRRARTYQHGVEAFITYEEVQKRKRPEALARMLSTFTVPR